MKTDKAAWTGPIPVQTVEEETSKRTGLVLVGNVKENAEKVSSQANLLQCHSL